MILILTEHSPCEVIALERPGRGRNSKKKRQVKAYTLARQSCRENGSRAPSMCLPRPPCSFLTSLWFLAEVETAHKLSKNVDHRSIVALCYYIVSTDDLFFTCYKCLKLKRENTGDCFLRHVDCTFCTLFHLLLCLFYV